MFYCKPFTLPAVVVAKLPVERISDVMRDQELGPRKHRVRATVVDYTPRSESAANFVKLYCCECHYL